MKTLSFTAEEVTATARNNKVVTVDIETDYPSEILDNFEPDEIIKHYDQLEELYELLKTQYE